MSTLNCMEKVGLYRVMGPTVNHKNLPNICGLVLPYRIQWKTISSQQKEM